MVHITVKVALTLLALMVSLVFSMNVTAMEINDADALKGVTIGKAVFLVNLGDPEKTAHYLSIINSTNESMKKQRTEPDFVVVFVGQTVRFLTTEPEAALTASHKNNLQSIAASVKALKEKGALLEVCSIATDYWDVSNKKLLPGLKIVGNGFTSMIGYQTKGYGLVPIM